MTESRNISVSLLFLALAMAIYFFLSIKRMAFFMFILLSMLILLHSYFTEAYFYSIALLLNLTIFSLYRLSTRQLCIYIGLHLLSIAGLTFKLGEYFLESLVITSFISFVTLVAHYYYNQRTSSEREVKKLEAQLRSLKRRNLSMEQAARMEERTKIMR